MEDRTMEDGVRNTAPLLTGTWQLMYCGLSLYLSKVSTEAMQVLLVG